MSRLLTFLSLCLIATMLPASVPAQAQGATTARLVTEFDIPNSVEDKFPSVATSGRTVHVAGNANKLDALYWNKGDTDNAFTGQLRLGEATGGDPDYTTATIATGADGRAYYMWGNLREGRLYMRVRETNGTWGTQRTVVARPFAIFPAIAVGPTGIIYAAWVEAGAPTFMRTSSDNGITWSSSIPIAAGTVFSVPITIAIGPNGLPAIAYTDEDLRVFVAFWNGSSFSREAVSPGGRLMANAGLTYTPNGKLYAVYRGVESTGLSSGVHYIERVNGQWGTPVLLASGRANGMVNVISDTQGNLHFAWVGEPTGTGRLSYAFRSAATGAMIGPVTSTTGGIFNARLAVNIGNEAYAHVVAERFDGGKPRIHYYRFAVNVAPPGQATPVLEDGKAQVKRMAQIKLGFLNVAGTPNQVRWRWGAAPDDTQSDSGGWTTYANPKMIDVPGTDRIPISCNAVTLYTQVKGDGFTDVVRSDAIILDGSIDATLVAINPFMRRKAATFTDAQPADLSSNGGASDGAPNYTRAPIFYLELSDKADCSDIKDVATGSSVTTIAPPYEVTNNFYANVVPIPGSPAPGSNTVIMRVSDGVGNISDYSQTFIYDIAAPVLSTSAPGTLAIISNPGSTLITQLSITNAQVTDDRYPAPGFWGVWVANSRTPVADPANDLSLFWLPLEAPGNTNTFTINGWSLSSGLDPAQVTPGAYHVYVRFLDGAGNPTSGFLTASVNLTVTTKPEIYLPLLRR